MCGLVVVDKPAGPTSHDIVNRLRRLYDTRRVGHAGTLDPPATGILLVGLGRATRTLQFLQGLPKTYRAVISFGATTSTLDATGEVLDRRPCSFGTAEIEAAAALLVGEISQVPPMVSAVRVGGERLYVAARRGEEVERAPRRVHVYRFSVEEFDPESYEACVEVRCSSGTYVRTLAADLGESLGCGAHLRSLRRTCVGSLGEGESVNPVDLEAMSPAERAAVVLPMAAALRDLPVREVAGDELAAVGHGRGIPYEGTVLCPGGPGVAGESVGDAGPGRPARQADPAVVDATPVAVVDATGELVAVYRRSGEDLVPAAVLIGG